MREIFEGYKKTKQLHHAYFLVGETEEIRAELFKFFENDLKIKTGGNPDFWYGKFENLGVDHARNIIESSEKKDFGGEKKIFIIETDFINHEAQNSLLKAFEEPTSGTHFFVISPQDILLPTLRSRMQIIELRGKREEVKAKSILDLNLKNRLEKVKEITEAIKDEEKTKQDAISFLNQVEKELYEIGVEKSAKSLQICELTRLSLYDRGAPIKMILENLVLSI